MKLFSAVASSGLAGRAALGAATGFVVSLLMLMSRRGRRLASHTTEEIGWHLLIGVSAGAIAGALGFATRGWPWRSPDGQHARFVGIGIVTAVLLALVGILIGRAGWDAVPGAMVVGAIGGSLATVISVVERRPTSDGRTKWFVELPRSVGWVFGSIVLAIVVALGFHG